MATLPPISNPTPKARFRSSTDNVTKHRHLVDSPEFQRAADFAMAEYTARLAVTMEPAGAAVMGLKIQGAHEFLQQMRNLSEEPRQVNVAATNDNLRDS